MLVHITMNDTWMVSASVNRRGYDYDRTTGQYSESISNDWYLTDDELNAPPLFTSSHGSINCTDGTYSDGWTAQMAGCVLTPYPTANPLAPAHAWVNVTFYFQAESYVYIGFEGNPDAAFPLPISITMTSDSNGELYGEVQPALLLCSDPIVSSINSTLDDVELEYINTTTPIPFTLSVATYGSAVPVYSILFISDRYQPDWLTAVTCDPTRLNVYPGEAAFFQGFNDGTFAGVPVFMSIPANTTVTVNCSLWLRPMSTR